MVAEPGERMARRVLRRRGPPAECASIKQTREMIGGQIVDAYMGKTAEQDTKVAVVPSQRRTLQSARERIPVALVSETAPRDEGKISGTPISRAMEGPAKAIGRALRKPTRRLRKSHGCNPWVKQ